jgi:carboxymethylenebutenolidase
MLSLMTILIVALSFIVVVASPVAVPLMYNAYSQVTTTGLSAMTLVSFGSGNSSEKFTNLPIENKTVTYFGTNTTGYLAFPSQNESNGTSQNIKFPAIVMIHENKGLNDYIKKSANLLAKNGYVVLAVDLFKGEVVTNDNPSRSSQLTSEIRSNPNIAIENMKSAVKYLQSLNNVNSKKIASIGWCFGGGQSLQLALNSKDDPLSATVLYYGVPLTNDTQKLVNIKWPVLGIFGGKDKALPLKTVDEFKKALDETGIVNEVYVYPNVGHAFANPSNPNYGPQETADAWKKTLDFLERYLQT